MCGIAGIVGLSASGSPHLTERLTAMEAALHHRGPDDSGMFATDDGSAGLITTRLAIRDLSAAGHMPMLNDNRDVALSYNGEVYNADDLRATLQDLGYRFRSTSDTEVILRGYEAWGREVVSRLRGMFAFAILDLREGKAKLLLARDRLGIKPLYYSVGSQGLVFASELRALVRSEIVDARVSSTSVVMYLLLGSVPKPFTIFEGVMSLPPASTLEFVTGKVELRTYWRFPEPDGQLTREDAEAQVRELLTDSVRRHLVSDVPLGVFLSGGLDSGIITALMRSTGVDALRTCSISFPATPYDESSIARVVAAASGSEHFEEAVTAGDLEGGDRLYRGRHGSTQYRRGEYVLRIPHRQAGRSDGRDVGPRRRRALRRVRHLRSIAYPPETAPDRITTRGLDRRAIGSSILGGPHQSEGVGCFRENTLRCERISRIPGSILALGGGSTRWS